MIFRNNRKIFMRREQNNHERPEAYPKPTETDGQMKTQDEFATLKPNDQVEPDSTHISETKGRESNRSETQGDD